MKAKSVMGVNLDKIKIDFVRMLCSRWNIKKYWLSSRMKCLELMAHHQLLSEYYRDQARETNLSIEEVQGSKMRLLNVIFCDDFFTDVCKMNDSKTRAALDAGKIGHNQRLWSEISEAYNDQANNSEYGSFAFVEDVHVEGFLTTYDLKVYEQLTWVTAGKWFKEIVKDYDRFMVKYTTLGQAQPDFHGYVEGKKTRVLLQIVYSGEAGHP